MESVAAFFLSLDEPFDRETRITEWRSRLADDREIWKKISQGDADAFDTLYRENAPRLLLFVRRVIGDPQAAEDVVQEMFTQIWNRPNGFQPERGTTSCLSLRDCGEAYRGLVAKARSFGSCE